MARKRLARWFAAANARRGELISSDSRLTKPEQDELEYLQQRCGDEVDRVFPRPPLPELPPGMDDDLTPG